MKDMNFLKDWQISHRGLHNIKKNIPENTMLAYEAALESDYAIELDITMLKDGTIVCFHDKDLVRASNLKLNLSKLTFDELKDIKIFNTNETIPRFIEVLDYVNGRVPLLIEIKAHKNYKLMLPTFIRLMESYSGEFAVFSFSPYVVNWFKTTNPHIIRGQISSFFEDNKNIRWPLNSLMKSLAFNKITKPDFISYHNINLPNKYVDKERAKGRLIISYTADRESEYNRIRKLYDNVVFEKFIPKK